MQGADFDDHLAGVTATGMGAVGGFAAENFHAGFAHGGHAQLREQTGHLFQNGIGHHLAFLRGVDAPHQK